MPAPDYSSVTKDIQGGYNAQRQQAAQQEGANLQGQRDALARRAAALGNAPGGAFVKAEQQAGNESAQRLQRANEGINQAQNQELRGVHMTQLGQQFTSSEREAGQQFAAGQQQAQFGQQKELQGNEFGQQNTMQKAGFGQQEKMQGQQQVFQAEQQGAAFGQQAKMQTGQQNWQGQQNTNAQAIQMSQFLQNMGFEQQKFAEQTGVDKFNEDMANKMFEKKDMLEKLFSQFGANNMMSGFGGSNGGGTGQKVGEGLGYMFGGGGGVGIGGAGGSKVDSWF